MQVRLGIFIAPDATDAESTMGQILAADQTGLEFVGVQDHPYQWRFFDTWTLLAYAAGRAEHVRFVPDVLNPPMLEDLSNIGAINIYGLPHRIMFPDNKTMLEILLMYVGMEQAIPIVQYLESYFKLRLCRVTGFRAGGVRLLNDENVWPVVEWREGTETDVLAIFKVMGQSAPCMCLTHYGEGIVWQDRKRWRESQLTWQIAGIEDLCDLLVIAQHILGMLHWSEHDSANLHLKGYSDNCSAQQCCSALMF